MADVILNNYIRAVLPTTDQQTTVQGPPAASAVPVALKKKFNPGLEEVS